MDLINNELPICSAIMGDLNAWCLKLCNQDSINLVGHEIDTLTSSAGYQQFMSKLTYIVNNLSSCIDLIFCNNLNLVSNCGV